MTGKKTPGSFLVVGSTGSDENVMYSNQTYEAPNTLDYVYIYTCKPPRSILKGLAFTGFLGDSLCGFAKYFLGSEKKHPKCRSRTTRILSR